MKTTDLVAFLQGCADKPDVPEFVRNAVDRTRFNGLVARAMGLDCTDELGYIAIIRRRDEHGKASPRLGWWDGVGEYATNVQDIVDQLIPADHEFVLQRIGLSQHIAHYHHPGLIPTVGHAAQPARALLLAVLRAQLQKEREAERAEAA